MLFAVQLLIQIVEHLAPMLQEKIIETELDSLFMGCRAQVLIIVLNQLVDTILTRGAKWKGIWSS